jgi:hypothetical protein
LRLKTYPFLPEIEFCKIGPPVEKVKQYPIRKSIKHTAANLFKWFAEFVDLENKNNLLT